MPLLLAIEPDKRHASFIEEQARDRLRAELIVTESVDAALETLKRVVALTPPRLLNANGRPKYQLNFYAVNKKGETGCAALYPSKYAVHDGSKAEVRDAAYLYQGA